MTKEQYRKILSKQDWTLEDLDVIFRLIDEKAKKWLGLDIYPNQFEIVTYEQLLDVYSSIGLPINYPHWKFGKDYMSNHSKYLKGHMGLSYEMVINSDPCISYNLENNNIVLMTLVYAHACWGHNSFFKNNYMFKDWTHADGIVDYMKFARDYILKCEDKYGPYEVEFFLDACHSIDEYGVDQYKHPRKSLKKEQDRLRNAIKWEEERSSFLDDINNQIREEEEEIFHVRFEKKQKFESQENLLYFLEKNSPNIEPWQREILRIVRKISQYFFPQAQTKVANEGWATFCHYYIINRLYDEGYIPDSFMVEFLDNHTAVVRQLPYSSKYYSGLNPYTLGFNIFMDIKRICENPTEEDKEWFPDLAGKNWLEEVKFAMENFRDDSFIMQYLSPKVIRDMGMFSFVDDADKNYYSVSAIHDKRGYKRIRETLSKQYNRSSRVPNIQVTNVNKYTRELELTYYPIDGIELDIKDLNDTLEYIECIWGFDVEMHTHEESEDILDEA